MSCFNPSSNLAQVCQDIRRQILKMTTKAAAGHATSSISAVEIMTVLLFETNFIHPNYSELKNLNSAELNQKINQSGCDRFIFSKGHVSPLFFALYNQLGVLTETELGTFRDFDGILEGHSTPRFAFTEATTGSLGQGLGIGAGLALAMRMKKTQNEKKYPSYNQKLESDSRNPENTQILSNLQFSNLDSEDFDNFKDGDATNNFNSPKKPRNPNIFVLLGDSEMAEGSVWEALNLANYYDLDNLIGIIDLNRLGQTGSTQIGWESHTLALKIASFGWEVWQVDGHNLADLSLVYKQIKEIQKIENTQKTNSRALENQNLELKNEPNCQNQTKVQDQKLETEQGSFLEKTKSQIVSNSKIEAKNYYLECELDKNENWKNKNQNKNQSNLKTISSQTSETAVKLKSDFQSNSQNLEFLKIIKNGQNSIIPPNFGKPNRPKMIIAKTVKGKGVDFLENAQNWHGKALNQEQLAQALAQL